MIGIIAAAMTALVGVVVWYLKQQTKHQIKREDKRDERDAKREEKMLNMFQVELKALHGDGLKNARLNRKSITMIGALAEYLNRHFNGNLDKVNFKRKVKKANEQK